MPDINISQLSAKRNISTFYVNEGFIDERSLKTRSNAILQQLQPNSPLNSDFKPVCLSLQTLFFFSKFKVNTSIITAIFCIMLLLPIIKLNSISFSVYITGLTACSLEIIILLSFQIIIGFLYVATGLLFATFMCGLATGALIKPRFGLIRIQIIIGFFALLIALSVFFINYIHINFLTYSIFFILIFVLALLTGSQFAKALGMLNKSGAAQTSFLYGADLLGSALGSLLISAIILPLAGFAGAFIFIILLNTLAIALLALQNNIKQNG